MRSGRNGPDIGRRAFLWRAAAACSVFPVVGACGDARPPEGLSGGDAPESGGAVGRAATAGADGFVAVPVVRGPVRDVTEGWPAGSDLAAAGLHDAHASGMMAYVSRADRRVYVDRAFTDRVHFLLGAYTSVSTGLWRIPLPGDDPRMPIVAGDEMREFELTPLAEWNASAPPNEGDMRIRMGGRRTATVAAACAPVEVPVEVPEERPAGAPVTSPASPPGRVYLTAGPWAVERLDAVGAADGREEFVRVGTGRLHEADGCPGEGRAVEVLTWVVGVSAG